YEDSGLPLENTMPYIIESFDGVNIGVIGLIGELENSIAASRTENIEFLDPVITAGNYASELRNNHDVDIVVVYIHNGSYINDDLINLSGDKQIDGIFNGHTHWDQAGIIDRGPVGVPYAQANNYDTWMVGMSFVYDLETDSIESVSTTRLYANNIMTEYQIDQNINDILYSYQNDSEYLSYINEELTYVNGYFSPEDLVEWGASVIRDYANVDIGATNTGGFRVDMDAGTITMGDMMTIYPFDNVIKTSKMTGQQILDFYIEIVNNYDDVVFDDGLVPVYDGYGNIESLEVNGEPIILDQLYTVGAVDYIFDKSDYDFIEGEDIIQTTYLMRDLLVQDLKNSDGNFTPNGTNID
ncbi:MAG: 5'-nucleotidase C-terminal domain-containing protein, partial [Bacillota bacterium]